MRAGEFFPRDISTAAAQQPGVSARNFHALQPGVHGSVRSRATDRVCLTPGVSAGRNSPGEKTGQAGNRRQLLQVGRAKPAGCDRTKLPSETGAGLSAKAPKGRGIVVCR
ncbi:hypothetical protein D3C85_1669840 [compost metagenome]